MHVVVSLDPNFEFEEDTKKLRSNRQVLLQFP